MPTDEFALPGSETMESAPQDEAEPEPEADSSIGDFFQNLMPGGENKPQIQIDLN